MGRVLANTPEQTSCAVVIRHDLQRDHVGGILRTNNGFLHATNKIGRWSNQSEQWRSVDHRERSETSQEMYNLMRRSRKV